MLVDRIVTGSVVPVSYSEFVLKELFSADGKWLNWKIGKLWNNVFECIHFGRAASESIQSQRKDHFFHFDQSFMVSEVSAVKHETNEKRDEVFFVRVSVLGEEVNEEFFLFITLN